MQSYYVRRGWHNSVRIGQLRQLPGNPGTGHKLGAHLKSRWKEDTIHIFSQARSIGFFVDILIIPLTYAVVTS